jgi:hypothetical protein
MSFLKQAGSLVSKELDFAKYSEIYDVDQEETK